MMLLSLPHGAVNLKVLLIIVRINIDFNGPQIHHVISLATQHRCKQGWCHTFFPLLWNLSQAPEMETSFTDSNRIKASGSRWSIGGSWRNPNMYKALSDPFLGMTSLVQKGGADGRPCKWTMSRWYIWRHSAISSFLGTQVHMGES